MKKRTASLALLSLAGAGGAALVVPTLASAAGSDTSTTTQADRRQSAISDGLKGLVTDGTLTQAQADKVAATLATKLPRGGFGGRRGGPGGPRQELAAAATAVGISEADLLTALKAGKSLAEVAQTKGVSKDTLIGKLVAARQTELAAAVTSGRLTQAQADERKADLKAHITELVDRKGLPGRGMRHGRDGAGAPGEAPAEMPGA